MQTNSMGMAGQEQKEQHQLVRPFSLARLGRSSRKARREARVVIDQWNMHTFVSDVFGPKKTWLQAEFECSEWGFIQYLMHSHSVGRLLRLGMTTVGSVVVPPLGVLLYSHALLSSSASEKVRYIGQQYAHRNVQADEDWWFINGTGVNTGMLMDFFFFFLILLLLSFFSCWIYHFILFLLCLFCCVLI